MMITSCCEISLPFTIISRKLRIACPSCVNPIDSIYERFAESDKFLIIVMNNYTVSLGWWDFPSHSQPETTLSGAFNKRVKK
jgi:hypothetical protein